MSIMQKVRDAKAQIENLTVDQVAAEMASGEVLIVDIRDAPEQQSGIIPGSVHASRGMLEFFADPSSPMHREEFDPEKRVILHCGTGGRSALATVALKELGSTNVAHLDGGFGAWKEAGQPTESV